MSTPPASLHHSPFSSPSTYLHVDINSYFATMLQQKYPHLRGKPVGVVKEAGRTCIIAASKEAKALGISTGSNARQAQKIAPHLILVPAEFDFYLDTTKKLASIFTSISPDVEIFSLDEAFINLTPCQRHLYPDARRLSTNLQRLIQDKLGHYVTCNIGIAPNRFLAKLASEISPKGSVTTVTANNLDYFLSVSDFSAVCGIGHRLEKKLRTLGITSLFAINFVPDQDLLTHFGPFWSKQLRRMGRGEEPHLFSLIDKNPHMKSIGRSITLWQLSNNQAHIKRVLYNLTSEVIYKARRQQLAGRQVSLYLQGDHQSWGNHLTLRHHLHHTQEMFNLIYYHLYRSWGRNFPIIRFAVRLSLLQPLSRLTTPLLPSHQRQEQLHLAIDRLWDRFGLFSVTSALLKDGHPVIRPEVTGFLGDKKFHFDSTHLTPNSHL